MKCCAAARFRRAGALLAMLVLAASPAAAGAQQVEASPPARSPFWDTRVAYTHEWFTHGDHDRSTTRARIGRRIGRGSVAADLARVRDFSGTGADFGAEVYLPLWYHAEGYLRVAGAPDVVSLPERAIGAELLQHLDSGWSVGLGGWHRSYDFASLWQTHAAAGLLSGRWRLRTRAGLIRARGRTLPLAHVIARRYVGDDGGFAELVVAASDEVLDFLPRDSGSDEIITAPTWQVSALGQMPLHTHASIQIGAGYSGMRDFGARILAEAGIALRW